MRPSIRVEGLAKRYRIGAGGPRPDSFYEVLAAGLRAPIDWLRRQRAEVAQERDFWALRDVAFEVQPGEVLGVIGRNGAGKSTLLKVLARITPPTQGRIEIVGRVASLLEVGTGFHPELTGRENIFLNGAILGMTRREIAAKFDEIVAFAEVERFLDTPVKRYSSGMYVRLAFAVAAHLETDVLLVDEVLAVGDASFQNKCLAKMGEARGQGRTVVFVSHNMSAVHQLCTGGLFLDDGQRRALGSVSEVVQRYLASGVETPEVVWREPSEAPGSDRVRLHAVRVLCGGEPASELVIDRPATIEIDFWNFEEGIRDLCVNVYLRDIFGATAFSTANTEAANLVKTGWFHERHARGLYRARCVLPPNLLNDIAYRVSVYLVTLDPMRIEAQAEDVLDFHVRDTGAMREPGKGGEWHGLVRLPLEWRTERLTDVP